MSREAVETVRGVRMPVTVPGKKARRTLDERILVRVPVLFRVLAFAWSRVPRSSWLRRALTARILRQGYPAANRRDFEVLVVRFDPEIQLQFDGSLVVFSARGE